MIANELLQEHVEIDMLYDGICDATSGKGQMMKGTDYAMIK